MLIEQIHIVFMSLLRWKFLGASALLLGFTMPFFFRGEAVTFTVVKGGVLVVFFYDSRLKLFRLCFNLRQNFFVLIDWFPSFLKNCLKTSKSSLSNSVRARVNNLCGLLSYHLLLFMRIWSWWNEWFCRLMKLEKTNLFYRLCNFVIALCASHIPSFCVATNLALV